RHLLVAKREGKRFARRVLVERGPQGAHPPFGVRRAEDRERSRARVLVAILQEEKRQAAEVIAVEMGEKREVDRRRVLPGSREGLQYARTTVEQEGAAGRLDQVRAVRAASGSIGVSRTEHGYPHRLVSSVHTSERCRQARVEPSRPATCPAPSAPGMPVA